MSNPNAGFAGRGAIVIVGAGRGVGAAVARRFNVGGERSVGLIARRAAVLQGLVQELHTDGITAKSVMADITDFGALREALHALELQTGAIDTLCFQPLPRIDLIKPIEDSSAEDLMDALALSVGGAAAAVQQCCHPCSSAVRDNFSSPPAVAPYVPVRNARRVPSRPRPSAPTSTYLPSTWLAPA